MIGRSEDGWCILRTGGPRTVPLAKSLADAGFEAWTPIQVQFREKTRRKPAEERAMPILPTFVFARAKHLSELNRLTRSDVHWHPAFSVFRYQGVPPIISDERIGGLREAEAAALKIADARRRSDAGKALKDAKDQLRRALPKGKSIDMPTGPFAGFTGVVESSTRKEAWVVLPGGFRLKIDTWLVAQDVAKEPQLA